MTMIKKIAVLSAATAAFAATPAAAQDASNSEGTASINVVTPMTLVKDSDLAFGTVILSGTADATFTGAVVSMDETGAIDCDGGSTNLTCVETVGTAAGYTLTGSGDADVTLVVPSTVNISNGVAGDPDLVVDLVPEDSTGIGGALNAASIDGSTFDIKIPSGGSLAFFFGGEVTLDYNTPDGYYEGVINVEATYQ